MIGYMGKLIKKYKNIVEVTPENLGDISGKCELLVIEDKEPKGVSVNIPVMYILPEEVGIAPYPYLVKQEVNIDIVFDLLDKGEIDTVLAQAYTKINELLDLSKVKSVNSLKLFVYESLKQQSLLKGFMERYLAQFNGELEKLMETNTGLNKEVSKLEKLNENLSKQIDSMKEDIKNTVDTSVREGIAVNIPKITSNIQYMDTYDVNKAVKNKIFYFKDYGCTFLTSFCFAFAKYVSVKVGKVKTIIVSKDEKYRRKAFPEYLEGHELPEICVKINPTNSFWEGLIRRVEHDCVYIIIDKTSYSNVLLSGPLVYTYYGIRSGLDVEYYNVPIKQAIRACFTNDPKEIANMDLKANYIIPYIKDYMGKPATIQYPMYIKETRKILESIASVI